MFASAQDPSQGRIYDEIRNGIIKRMNKWIKKSEFETDIAYQDRIKTKSNEMLTNIKDSVVLSIRKKYLSNIRADLGAYNATTGKFLILTKPGFDIDSLYIKVSSKIAPRLSEFINRNVQEFNRQSITIIPKDIGIINKKLKLKEALIIINCDGKDANCVYSMSSYKLIITEIKNIMYGKCDADGWEAFKIEDLKKYEVNEILPKGVYYYKWNISEQPNFNPSDIKPISFDLRDMDISIPTIK